MKFKTLLAAGCLTATALTVQAQQTFSLTNADLTKARQEYGIATVGKAVNGAPAAVAGTLYPQSIGVHSPSTIKIDLHRAATRFTARVGIADNPIDYTSPDLTSIALVNGTKLYFTTQQDTKQFAGLEGTDGKVSPGSAVFVVRGDGKELYRSATIGNGQAPAEIDIPLKGVGLLELTVEPTSDGPSGDHALWIDPRIEYDGTQPESVDAGFSGEGPALADDVRQKLEDKINALPQLELPYGITPYDWLIDPTASKTTLYATADRKGVILANGMVAREFRIVPNLATVDIINRMTGESMIRAVSSEGTITLDGRQYTLGGLEGQPERGYLKRDWLDEMTTIPGSFLVEDFELRPVAEILPWNRNRWALNTENPTRTARRHRRAELHDLRPHPRAAQELRSAQRLAGAGQRGRLPARIPRLCRTRIAGWR